MLVALHRLLILPPTLCLPPPLILPAVIRPASDLLLVICPAVRVSASVEPEVPPTGLELLLKWILDVLYERIITQLTLIKTCLEIFVKFTDIVKALYSFCCKVEIWGDETRNKACIATVATVGAILFVRGFCGLTQALRKEVEEEKVAQGGGVEEDEKFDEKEEKGEDGKKITDEEDEKKFDGKISALNVYASDGMKYDYKYIKISNISKGIKQTSCPIFRRIAEANQDMLCLTEKGKCFYYHNFSKRTKNSYNVSRILKK